MKIARKNTESLVLFLWIPVMRDWGKYSTWAYNSAWKDANKKKNYSQFAISWQKTRVSELIGNYWAHPWWNGWVVSCSETLSTQGGQNRQWHNWPQQAPRLCSCFSSLTSPFIGMDEKWIRQENGCSQNLQGNLCCLGHGLLLPRMITRGDGKHAAGTGNGINSAGAEIGLTTWSINACSEAT